MKKIIILGILLGAMPAMSAGVSQFHLIDMKCEAEVGGEIETTPQSPPLDVDDPATPGCNKWEINVTMDGDITSEAKTWDLPLLDINYGIGDNLQLKYEVPYVNQTSRFEDEEGGAGGEVSVNGVGASEAGIKYKFFENEEANAEMAFYPQIEFVTPNTQSDEKGLAEKGTTTKLPILFSTKLGEVSRGDIMLSANASYNFSSQGYLLDSESVSVGLGMPLVGTVSVMAEVSGEQSVIQNDEEFTNRLLKADLGLVGTLNKTFLLYGSVGESLYSTDKLRHTYVLAGLRVLTGGMQ